MPNHCWSILPAAIAGVDIQQA
jgi:hypothetical protein